MPKNAIPNSFSYVHDLEPILKELDTQADAVLANTFVLQNLYKKYADSTDTAGRRDYAVVLQEHGRALETDLGIIKLGAELITDERLAAWVKAAAEDAERQAREERLDKLMEKMADVEEAMVELREGLVGEEGNFL